MGRRGRGRGRAVPSQQLASLGVRFVVDPVTNAHTVASPDHWSYTDVLDVYPPLSTAAPIVGVVAHDTVMFIHSAIAPPLVQHKLSYDDAVVPTRLWGVDVPLVTVTPPQPKRVFEYLCKFVYGCKCPTCATLTGLEAVRDYMDPGAGLVPPA